MKQLIFVVLVTALAVSMVSAQWTEVQGYRQVGFNGMHFLDTANGWFACNNSLVYRTTDGGRTLQQQTVPPSVGLADLEGVHFLNSQEGWIVGRNAYGGGPGAIIHTTNGGTTWEQQLHYVSNSVWYAVTKVGSAIWVGGGNAHGLILKSTNRGVSWQLTEYSQFGCIATITALDSQRVVINGTKGTLALTTNGGSTWQKANLDTNLQVDKVRFVSKSLGYAIATDFSKNPRFVYLYATVDGGSTWSIRYQWYDAWKPALSVMGDSTIFVGGFTSSASTYSGLLKSTDRGFTWKLEAAFEGTPYQIYTPDDKHGVAAGSGLYYYTPPPPPINHAPGWIFSVPLKIIYGGVTYRWPYQVIDADGDQVRVSVDYTKSPTWVTVDIVAGMVVIRVPSGYTGYLRYTLIADDLHGGVTPYNSDSLRVDRVTHVEGEVPLEFKLEQNYPNPFNPTTTISYNLPQSSNVNLVVYNALGQAVANLVNGCQNIGVHTVSFNGTSLPSGVYMYRITAGNYVATKRMLLVK